MEKYGKITPAVVGRYLGISAQTVRERMKDGTLPIGKVYQDGGKDRFLILPNLLYQETGIRLNGYEPPPVVSIDYEFLARRIIKRGLELLGAGKEEGEK